MVAMLSIRNLDRRHFLTWRAAGFHPKVCGKANQNQIMVLTGVTGHVFLRTNTWFLVKNLKENWKVILEVCGDKGHNKRPSPSGEEHAFTTHSFWYRFAYHLSRSALMLVQAAGTGASVGAAGVSESDMSVVLRGVLGTCPVLWMPVDSRNQRDRKRAIKRGRMREEMRAGERGGHTGGGWEHINTWEGCTCV